VVSMATKNLVLMVSPSDVVNENKMMRVLACDLSGATTLAASRSLA